MKKIPIGAEAASILIGQVEFLDEPIMAFCRLESAVIIESLSEVALPTRFILLALGPLRGTPIAEYCELGRAMAALLNDRVSFKSLQQIKQYSCQYLCRYFRRVFKQRSCKWGFENIVCDCFIDWGI